MSREPYIISLKTRLPLGNLYMPFAHKNGGAQTPMLLQWNSFMASHC